MSRLRGDGSRCGYTMLRIVVTMALSALLVMVLWNGVVADLTAASTVGFWQAAGLLVLARLLLGGIRLRVHRRPAGRCE